MDITEFLTACYDEELAGPGSRRKFVEPKGKPCPVEGCGHEIATWGFELYHDRTIYRVEHHVWGPMPGPDWYAGERGPSISEHPVPNDLWAALTRGDYTEEALKVQRRVAAYRAILAEHERAMREDDLGELDVSAWVGGLEFALKALASEFVDRPGFNPQWSLT